jgi:hypothetical protein
MRKKKRKLKTVIFPRPDLQPASSPQSSSAPRCSRIFLIAFLAVASVAIPRQIAAAPASDSGHEKPYALIFGTVWGPGDQPLYAVKVRLRREGDKKPKWEQYSDHRGEFAFRVPAGKATYYASADLKGYKLPDGSKLQPGTEVQVNITNDERSDIGLHLK